jgi:hypothetical protein
LVIHCLCRSLSLSTNPTTGDKQKKKEQKKDKAEDRSEGKTGSTTTSDSKEVKLDMKSKKSSSSSNTKDASSTTPAPLIDEASTRKRSAVALLQLTMKRATLLVHLAIIGFVPVSLVTLLEDPRVYKSGVGCTEDATYLYRDYSVHVRGTIELASVAARTPLPLGGVSLRALASDVLAVQLDKDFRIRYIITYIHPYIIS